MLGDFLKIIFSEMVGSEKQERPEKFRRERFLCTLCEKEIRINYS